MSSHNTAAAEAVTTLILATFRLNGRLLGAGDQLTRDLGLSSARWQVMGALRDGPLPVAQIARAMGLTRQSVQRIVDLLAAQGVLAFSDNPYHLRAKLVCLTERGQHLLREVSERQALWVNRLAADLSPDDVQVAVRLLDTLTQRLDGPVDEELRHAQHPAH
jgi:DNA-binding MarR family transcriptional regulator